MKPNLEHIFDTDLRVTRKEAHSFELDLSDCWSINNTPNGGYLMAVLANVMAQCSSKSATPIITMNYFSRCRPGKAEAKVEMICESANFTRLMVRLFQKGKEKIRGFGTFCSDQGTDALERYDSGPPDLAAFEQSVQIPRMDGYTLFDQVDVRLDPSCTGWVKGQFANHSKFKGWVQFNEERKLDLYSILLFSDSFPPPIFASMGPRAWVPTIELSVNIRHIPKTLRLKGLFQSRFVSAGLVEEDGELWDEDGKLVAVSRQISKYGSEMGLEK
jgi:hypothetical protein